MTMAEVSKLSTSDREKVKLTHDHLKRIAAMFNGRARGSIRVESQSTSAEFVRNLQQVLTKLWPRPELFGAEDIVNYSGTQQPVLFWKVADPKGNFNCYDLEAEPLPTGNVMLVQSTSSSDFGCVKRRTTADAFFVQPEKYIPSLAAASWHDISHRPLDLQVEKSPVAVPASQVLPPESSVLEYKQQASRKQDPMPYVYTADDLVSHLRDVGQLLVQQREARLIIGVADSPSHVIGVEISWRFAESLNSAVTTWASELIPSISETPIKISIQPVVNALPGLTPETLATFVVIQIDGSQAQQILAATHGRGQRVKLEDELPSDSKDEVKAHKVLVVLQQDALPLLPPYLRAACEHVQSLSNIFDPAFDTPMAALLSECHAVISGSPDPWSALLDLLAPRVIVSVQFSRGQPLLFIHRLGNPLMSVVAADGRQYEANALGAWLRLQTPKVSRALLRGGMAVRIRLRSSAAIQQGQPDLAEEAIKHMVGHCHFDLQLEVDLQRHASRNRTAMALQPIRRPFAPRIVVIDADFAVSHGREIERLLQTIPMHRVATLPDDPLGAATVLPPSAYSVVVVARLDDALVKGPLFELLNSHMDICDVYLASPPPRHQVLLPPSVSRDEFASQVVRNPPCEVQLEVVPPELSSSPDFDSNILLQAQDWVRNGHPIPWGLLSRDFYAMRSNQTSLVTTILSRLQTGHGLSTLTVAQTLAGAGSTTLLRAVAFKLAKTHVVLWASSPDTLVTPAALEYVRALGREHQLVIVCDLPRNAPASSLRPCSVLWDQADLQPAVLLQLERTEFWNSSIPSHAVASVHLVLDQQEAARVVRCFQCLFPARSDALQGLLQPLAGDCEHDLVLYLATAMYDAPARGILRFLNPLDSTERDEDMFAKHMAFLTLADVPASWEACRSAIPSHDPTWHLLRLVPEESENGGRVRVAVWHPTLVDAVLGLGPFYRDPRSESQVLVDACLASCQTSWIASALAWSALLKRPKSAPFSPFVQRLVSLQKREVLKDDLLGRVLVASTNFVDRETKLHFDIMHSRYLEAIGSPACLPEAKSIMNNAQSHLLFIASRNYGDRLLNQHNRLSLTQREELHRVMIMLFNEEPERFTRDDIRRIRDAVPVANQQSWALRLLTSAPA